MQAAGTARTPDDRRRLRRKCADLIALGERLKTAIRGSGAVSAAVSRPPGPPAPESSRPLTTTEKTVVLKASRLHGSIFPLWESAPAPAPASFTFAATPGGAYMCVTYSPWPISAVAPR
jgi:hypothetical protein